MMKIWLMIVTLMMEVFERAYDKGEFVNIIVPSVNI